MGNLDLTGIYTYRGAVLGGSKTLELEKAGLEEGATHGLPGGDAEGAGHRG